MSWCLTFDPQINVIAVRHPAQRVVAPIPVFVFSIHRPEGQQRPVDFGDFRRDWWRFRCFQHHPGDVCVSRLGCHGAVHWAAQVEGGARHHLHCPACAVWKGGHFFTRLMAYLWGSVESDSNSDLSVLKTCFGHECDSILSRFHSCTAPHLIFATWSAKARGFCFHQAPMPLDHRQGCRPL